MSITRNLIAVFSVCFALSTATFAQFVDFSSQTADGPTWTVSDPFGLGGIMTASFSSSFSDDVIRWLPQTKSFSDQAFQAMFGSSGSLITLRAQNDQPTETTNVTFMFSNPAPSDARLVVFDLDGRAERHALSSVNGPISAPIEMESNDPSTSPLGASDFASWSPSEQQLLSTNSKQNDREAYVFDISGFTQIELVMSADQAASNWVGIAQVVPEPGSLTLFMFGLVVLGIRRRRS